MLREIRTTTLTKEFANLAHSLESTASSSIKLVYLTLSSIAHIGSATLEFFLASPKLSITSAPGKREELTTGGRHTTFGLYEHPPNTKHF